MISLKDRFVRLKNTLRLIRKERKSSVSTSFWQKVFCYSRGFLSESYVIYNFKENNHKDYLSDYRRFVKTPFINTNFGYLIDNKFIFDLYFSNTIKSLGLINSGLLFAKDEVKPLTTAINELLSKGCSLVIKPLGGGGGFGILFLKSTPSGNYINDESYSDESLRSKLKDPKGYILYNHFNQLGFSNSFYPQALNTLRVVTMINPKTQEPFIPIAVHRFGTFKSGNVDNWSSGGLSAGIDVDTGKMGKAVAYLRKDKLEWQSVHPDTGKQIEGVVIPNWLKVKEIILQTARKTSMIPYVGWDVVLSNDDVFILEANTNSDVNLLQVHKPLLTIPGVREFFKSKGVL
ncbi:MAG: hypothetical protein KGZ97_10825 [Bacteroidetes bacterium]|nr:hypothetical protein [Bacteroidota bacterium]